MRQQLNDDRSYIVQMIGSIVLVLAMMAFVMVFASVYTVAQDDEPVADCDLEAISEYMGEFVDGLPDFDDPGNALDVIDDLVHEARIECFGMSWNSDDEGMQPVLGPRDFDEGVYLVTVTTTGYFVLEHTVLDGGCRDYQMTILYTPGDAADGAQEVWDIPDGGCELLMNVSTTSESWVMDVEKLR